MKEIVKFIEKYEKIYPDLMVLDKMDDWHRAKQAGKVELLKEMKLSIKSKDENNSKED
jgi:hypothetical protein